MRRDPGPTPGVDLQLHHREPRRGPEPRLGGRLPPHPDAGGRVVETRRAASDAEAIRHACECPAGGDDESGTGVAVPPVRSPRRAAPRLTGVVLRPHSGSSLGVLTRGPHSGSPLGVPLGHFGSGCDPPKNLGPSPQWFRRCPVSLLARLVGRDRTAPVGRVRRSDGDAGGPVERFTWNSCHGPPCPSAAWKCWESSSIA